MQKSLSQNLPIILMCCSVFNNLLPQTPVCCHGNDSSTNTGLGLSGRRREIMNKQLCSIISNSMKKPQMMNLDGCIYLCLNTSTSCCSRTGFPQHTWLLGQVGPTWEHNLSSFCSCFPLLPLYRALHRSGFSQHQPKAPSPSLWEFQLGGAGCPSSGGHCCIQEHLLHVQAMSCSSLQQIKAFKSFFFKNGKSFLL